MRSIRPATYRTIVAAAGVSLAAIVLTGAAVRLTQAGLGCENWPACTEERFVPEWEFHPWIEFGNRLISGIVALAVAVAALTAYRRSPRRPDLIRLAWGLVAGVAAQIVLGGITVRVDLHPAIVGLHFLLSMVLLWNACLLWVRAGAGGPETQAIAAGSSVGPLRVPGTIQAHGRLMVALATLVLVTGTLVTGTGPNSGDARAERLTFDLSAIARVHSITVWCFLAVALALAIRLGASPASEATGSPFAVARALVAATVVQGGVGYVQFATGVPPGLVAVHILGAVIVWLLAILLHLRLFERPPSDGVDHAASGMTDGERMDMNTVGIFDTMGS